ncbi:hypothetical protein KR067_006593 [Drosophila pandora]|nr:hypothetical protein KR067_006593 [Drosophila pandora]
MAEQRRRYRNKKRDDQQSANVLAPVTIARRCDDPRLVQPKILLKKDRDRDRDRDKDKEREQDRERERDSEIPSSGSSNQDTPSSIKTIIINRTTDARLPERYQGMMSSPGTGAGGSNPSMAHVPVPGNSVCAALVSSSTAPNSCRDRSCNSTPTANGATPALQDIQPPRMTRPTPLIVANGVFNANARKLFNKTNTDFTVIGILGSQSSGKSTLLNLLTADRPLDYDYYQHLFAPEADECIFATRPKKANNGSQKNVLRPRTDALQFFITRERHILVDTPPLLATCKEADNLDMHCLGVVAQLLSVCHVLILVIDGVAVEHLRLLNAALRLRPRFPCKGYVRDHIPQVMFVRNRAQRLDFEPQQRERMEKMLTHLYEPTGLPIYRGRGEARCLNTFLLPDMAGNEATAYHPNLGELVRQFRERVLSSPRTSMCSGGELSEAIWFEILAETARKSGPNFEKIHSEIKLRHLDARTGQWGQRTEQWRNDT